jgi:hypothetical protein
MPRLSTLARGACLALALGVSAAIALQDWAGPFALELTNREQLAYRWLSLAGLCASVSTSLVLALELFAGRGHALARQLRRVLLTALATELCLSALDVAFVSGVPGSRLGGPFFELRTKDGAWLPLRRPHPGSRFGFRSAREPELASTATRFLFLGDSYTEGSGRAPDCNYPDVVQAELRRRTGSDVEVVNAGVGGYGPREEAELLRFLIREGYRFDAVVVSWFLENDLTDDLPGTARRVYWGMIERVPSAPWLRWLHPWNWRSARLARTLGRLSQLNQAERLALWRPHGECRFDERGDGAESLAALRGSVAEREQRNRTALDNPELLRSALESLGEIRRLAEAEGAPVFVVLFPARALADEPLRAELAAESGDDSTPALVHEWALRELSTYWPIDTTPVLQTAGGAAYRPADTHLSDRGNRIAGEWVADELAERASALGLFHPPPSERAEPRHSVQHAALRGLRATKHQF